MKRLRDLLSITALIGFVVMLGVSPTWAQVDGDDLNYNSFGSWNDADAGYGPSTWSIGERAGDLAPLGSSDPGRVDLAGAKFKGVAEGQQHGTGSAYTANVSISLSGTRYDNLKFVALFRDAEIAGERVSGRHYNPSWWGAVTEGGFSEERETRWREDQDAQRWNWIRGSVYGQDVLPSWFSRLEPYLIRKFGEDYRNHPTYQNDRRWRHPSRYQPQGAAGTFALQTRHDGAGISGTSVFGSFAAELPE